MPLTPATLADDITAMLAAYKLYDEEFQDWLNGAAGGGVALDGKFPLTSRLTGVTRQTKSPAQLEADVTGVVDSANTYATAAQNAQTAAETAETNAQTAETNALAHKDNAVAAQSAAEAAQSAAENAAVNALAQANNAATSYDQFDDRYLGVFTTALEPTVDNDGDALLAGAIYWNSDLAKFKVYSGSAWGLAFDLSEADNFTWTGLHTFDQYLSLTPMAAPAHTEGRLWYDSAAKSLSYYNDEADVTINVGQETVVRVRNVTGALIPNGAAVYVSGATGASLPNVALAQANSAATAEVLGIATHDIENNSNGYVTVVGDVNDVDTSAWAAGTELFLSDSVAGGLTDVKPNLNDVRVGYVTVSNVSVGSIKVQVGLPVNHNHPASEITSGTFADARIAASNVTQHQAALALATSQITSGTFADARIAQSNVTQHQAALAITESQISDLRFKDQGTGNGVDFDTIHATEGFWGYTTTATNEPFDYGILLNLSDGAQAVQMAFGGSADGKLAIRRRDSGVFYGWTHAAMLSNSGKLPDVDVAQSNVTQHQAALSITESQISDLGSYLPLGGGTMTGRLIAGFTDDVNLLGISGSLIIGGDGTSAHIAIDNNEIMAKATATTSSTLNLQVEGGTVACGGPLTATAITEGGTALSSKYLGISAKAADSSLLNGVAESTAAAVNTIVKRTASGYVYGVYFNSSQGAETSAASHYIYQNGSDGFYRKKTLANAQAEIVTAAAINAVGTTTNTGNTVAKRDGSGDVTARLFRPEYNASAAAFNYVNVQNARGTGDNYIRAATLANFRARVNAGYLGDQPYTVSTASPSGGNDGDFWFKREA